MKTLVLAEKPSVGKDIARVLNCKSGGAGYIEGPQYIVTWALGHLVTLADPEDYDKNYKNWDITHLPIMPEKLRLTVIPQSSKQYKIVKGLLFRKDVNSLVIATDAGREGELVARWIIEMAKCKLPIKRLWISSVTDKAIREGFQNLKEGKLYIPLCDSAKARAEADWLVGINATRCLTTKFNSPLSCGRVQTPTLAIIVKREEEIRKFVPQPYYGLLAKAASFDLTWEGGRIFDRAKAEGILAQIKDFKEGTVSDISKTIKKKYPPKLYDLTELQRDANKRFDYSAKETLQIMQRLYEEHKILSYPRTDSRYITSDIVPTIAERLKACAAPPYAKICAQLLRATASGGPSIRANANFVDDSKVSDHHAIIPTEHPLDLPALSDRERKIYDLVVTRFLSVFFPPFEYEQVRVKVNIGGEVFRVGGRVILSQGYQSIYQDDDDEETAKLPSLKKGEAIAISSLKMTEGKTSPPAPFNEATLLSAMESPAKYMETKDQALAETLKSTGGLGTVATRADIIEKLFDNFMLEKRGKDIFSTSKGRQLLSLIPQELKSPELTGAWEQKLSSISRGKLNKNDFLRDIRKYTAELIGEIKESTAKFRHDNLSSTKCPKCGMFMLQVKGKKGEMLVCQDRECNSRVNLSLAIRSKCPRCHKFLNIVGEGEKRQIVCACGHKEKYAAFDKRMKEAKNTMSKKEVQAYLNKSQKSEASPNAFAALKNLKFE